MVLCVTVPLKDAQIVKRFLIDNSLFDKKFDFKKEKSSINFPIIEEAQSLIEGEFAEIIPISFSKVRLKSRIQAQNLKTKLSKSFSESEMNILKSSFDTVGSIAILEIPRELVKRQKIIAETLLKLNKNIKTVLKKAGVHGTTFRTQKMIFLAGKKTKESTYKELGVQLKLDVEKVYFSPRLSTERKRIAHQVKSGENILVMFSGCAPYPCTLSKLTDAKHITGIELNPVGHKYGLENLKLNKIHNVTLINGDVNEVVPKIYHFIIGLKSSDKPDELKTRLEHHPVIMELHLFDSDLREDISKLKTTIESLQKKGIQVILHMPFSHNEDGVSKRYSLGQTNIDSELKMFHTLGSLCKKYHIKSVIHPTQDIGIAEKEEILVSHIKLLDQYFDYFYFENVTHGLFAKTEDILRIGKSSGIKNMCIDLCHLYIMYQDNDKIELHVNKIQKYFNTYFHINDHDYKTHSCEIGKGFVDVKSILPYVNIGVTEICNKDEKMPVEMVRSYLSVERRIRKFDRIIMPLPKSAHEFLDSALKVSKKGTVIHFYDFLHVDNFQEAHKKIEKACKKRKVDFKIIRTVKCGQHAPKIFRICVDFKIM